MGLINTAVVLASEEPLLSDPFVPSYLFGVFAFVALAVGLVVVMMLKVGN